MYDHDHRFDVAKRVEWYLMVLLTASMCVL